MSKNEISSRSKILELEKNLLKLADKEGVVGNNGMIATSTDGINYTVQSPAVDTTGDGSPDFTVARRSVCSNVQGAGFS